MWRRFLWRAYVSRVNYQREQITAEDPSFESYERGNSTEGEEPHKSEDVEFTDLNLDDDDDLEKVSSIGQLRRGVAAAGKVSVSPVLDFAGTCTESHTSPSPPLTSPAPPSQSDTPVDPSNKVQMLIIAVKAYFISVSLNLQLSSLFHSSSIWSTCWGLYG